MSVLQGLRASAKGQLRYDSQWRPTAKSLEECSSPPRVSEALVSIFSKLSLQDSHSADDGQISNHPLRMSEEDRTSVYSPTPTAGQTKHKSISKNNSRSVSVCVSPPSETKPVDVEVEVDVLVSIHNYDKIKKQEARGRVESRREQFEKHSQKLQQDKQHYLQEVQEKKDQQFLKEVEEIQQCDRKKTEEANRRQEKLLQEHKECEARAVRKVKQVEALRQQIEEEARNKQEIEKLEVLVQQLKTTAMSVHKSFKECKYQMHLSAAAPELLSEINKILQMASATVANAKQSGKPSEKDQKIILEFAAIMGSVVNKAKLVISEAQAKAAKEQAELEAKARADEARKTEEAQKLAAAQASTAVAGTQNTPNQTSVIAKPKGKSNLPGHLQDCVSESAFKEYSQQEKLLEDTSKAADALISDKSKPSKQYRFDLQKAVTTPVNAISDQSPSHLLDKIQRLVNLLSGKPVQVTGKQVSANSQPAQAYCRDLLAKKLVMQGSQQVSTSHNSAFPIAAVAIAVSAACPEVRNLIMGHFYKTCPFLVPFYIPMTEGTSDQDYYKSLGYECSGGTIEPQDKFLKRMTGLVRLYAAVISSMPPPGVTNHPFGLELGWAFLARILNLRPRADFTATAIYEFLDVAGHALQRQYGKQFWKLLHVLVRDYLPKVNEVTAPAQSGPVVRLKGFLEGCIKNRTIKIPDGYLTPRWWKSSSGGFGY